MVILGARGRAVSTDSSIDSSILSAVDDPLRDDIR
jgi:hypothetical protein